MVIRLLLALLLIAVPVSATDLYTTTTQVIYPAFPMNDGNWYPVLMQYIPSAKAGQILTVMAQQEVTNLNPYLVFVGAVVTATGMPLLAPAMAYDVEPGYHMPLTSLGTARVPVDGPIQVIMWIWGGSAYGSGSITIEGYGYGKMTVTVE